MTESKSKGQAKAHAPGFLKLVDEVKKRVKEIGVVDVLEKLKKKEPFHFVDVREDHEWEEGYCLGAVHIARGILERDIEREIPDKSAEIVLYCGGGFRSALAADNLRLMGYKNVLSMAGGFREWQAVKGPVVRGSHEHRKL
jgi:rhodanese-related sulfurtransferase